MSYLPRNFVTTVAGLVFALFERFIDEPRIPCFLRYRPMPDGRLQEFGTDAANTLYSGR